MQRILQARNAVAISFFLNGFAFASWVSRIPEARHELSLTNGALGLLLLTISFGSVLALPSSGALVNRFGAANVVRTGISLDALGLVLVSLGAGLFGSVALTAMGLFVYGLGVGVWDVGMNIEGAAVERLLRRTIMPRFHAGFSFGTVTGAAVGAVTTGVGLPLEVHLISVAVVLATVGLPNTGQFLPALDAAATTAGQAPRRSAWAAWLEPRTLLIGAMVFALALTEGTANDWLGLALIDGYDVERWVGVAGYTLFVVAMTAGRLVGTAALDRFGRAPVLWSTIAAAAVGLLLIVFGGNALLVVPGIVLWGLGASLGFPVGISAASDEEEHAAARVSVVSTIAYTAFLGGPPLLGFLADDVGTLRSLLAVAVLLAPAAFLVPAARKQASAQHLP